MLQHFILRIHLVTQLGMGGCTEGQGRVVFDP